MEVRRLPIRLNFPISRKIPFTHDPKKLNAESDGVHRDDFLIIAEVQPGTWSTVLLNVLEF